MGTRAPVKRTVQEPRQVGNPYVTRLVPAQPPTPSEVPGPEKVPA